MRRIFSLNAAVHHVLYRDSMTTEERFITIENFLKTVAEHQAHFAEGLEAQRVRHETEIADVRELQNALAAGMIRFDDRMIRFQEAQEKSHEEMKELREEFREGMNDLREAQRTTEEKLNALIDTVERIISNRNI